MATKPIRESVLLKTSAATDVQCSGGVISITGLKSVSKRNISAIKQVKYKAEVAQVVTVSTTAAPTASTTYAIAVYDQLRVQAGYEESPKIYKYTTTSNWSLEGATDALRREYINGKLITAINNDATCHATAVTLGTGTGFTVTDSGSYYPVWAQNMTNVQGVNNVYTITNPDGSGFASNLATVTTAAVYSFGVGANLLAEKPVVDYVYGNLISGVLDAPPVTFTNPPTGAVSGQNYDGFVIESLHPVDAIGVTGQYAYVERIQRVFVDNGTGSATTNLTGFKAFERVMHKLMVQVYSTDASCVQEWFDKPIVFQDPLGAAPTGTANTLGWQLSPYGSMNRTNIGTATVVAPVLSAAGLTLDQDATAGEGSHTSANQQTLADQSFVVGKTAFMVAARIVMTDITKSHIMVGVRKKAAYTADYNDYTDLAAIGTRVSAVLGAIATTGILANAATVETVSSDVFVNSTSAVVWVKVDINGAVSCYVNGKSYPIYSAGTTALVFTAGDEFIPFYEYTNVGSSASTTVISEFFAVATDTLIS